jgi:hypothetical protein
MDSVMMDHPDQPEALAVHDGEMTIPLDQGTAVLTANLFAAKGLSRHFGGFQAALNRLAAGDLEAMFVVVRYGLGIKSDSQARGLEDRVYRAGVFRLTAPLTEFVLICANGGKKIEDLTPAPGESDGDDP